MPSKIESSEFCCRNEDCPDYGKKQNGNIVLKESYGKQNRVFLQCKTCKNFFGGTQGTTSFGRDAPQKIPVTSAMVPEKESTRRSTEHNRQINLTNNSKQYTREELILRLQGKARELGRTPKCKDLNEDPGMPSVYTYYTKFGSMTKALKEAGLTPNKVGRHKKYSDIELLEILRSKARIIGRIPTSEDVDADSSMPSYTTYQYHFGSFQDAIRKAGLKPIIKHYIRDSKFGLPNMFREKEKKTEHTPTPKVVDSNPNMPSGAFRYRSGPIKNAIRKAGSMQPETGRYSRYTKIDLLDMLREKAKELGRIPTQNELNSDPDMPSFSTYVYRFGSFHSVCKKVGLLPRKLGRSAKYTDAELLDMLRSKAKELGRPLGWDDLGKHNKMPARQVYTIRFGGLRKAMKKAGIL